MKRLPLLCLLSALASPLFAQTLQEQMDEIRRSSEALSTSSVNAASPGSLQAIANEYRDFSSNLSTIESYVQNGNLDEAIRNLRRWLSRTKNEQVKNSLESLLKGLQDEQKKLFARQSEALDELLKKARTVIAENKPVDSVIAVREEIEEFRDLEVYNGGRASRRLQYRVDNAINFLNGWQRFVIAESNGANSEALSQLRNLREGSYGVPLADEATIKNRAEEIIARIASGTGKQENSSAVAKALTAIVDQIKTPADAMQAAETTRRLNAVGNWDNTQIVNNLTNALSQLAKINQDFEDGLYGRVLSASWTDYRTPFAAKLDPLVNQLRIQSAIRANDLPDLGPIKEGEGFGTFLRRAARESFDKKDWPTLFALLSVYANTTGGCSRTQGMQEGVRAFIAASQLEQASQWGDAIRLYTQCVAQIGPFVPRAEAAAALARLKESHPDVFNPTGTISTHD